MLQNRSPRTLILTLMLVMSLSSGWVISAQDETVDEMTDMPEVLVEGIEERSENSPELLDMTWAEYSDREITLWLPESFELTLVEDLLELAQDGDEFIEPELQSIVQAVYDNPDVIRFVAMNTTGLETGVSTNIIFIREPAIVGLELEAVEMLAATVEIMPDSITVRQEAEVVELEGFGSVASAQWEFQTGLLDTVSIVYIIIDGDYYYSMNFTTTEEYIDYYQIVAELAMQTLVIDREEGEE